MISSLHEQIPFCLISFAQRVPGHLAFLTLEGNMQHVPMERLNPDAVYNDIQEVKAEAAAWVVENVEL